MSVATFVEVEAGPGMPGPDTAAWLYGLGGVGKTELALHYAAGSRDRYRLIGWSPQTARSGSRPGSRCWLSG